MMAERVFNILDEIPMVEEVLGDFVMSDTSIKSNNISFAYPNRGNNVLIDIT